MAIDTRTKRASVLGWGLAALVAFPDPAGAIDQAARQHVAGVYAGISAGVLIDPAWLTVAQAALVGPTLRHAALLGPTVSDASLTGPTLRHVTLSPE